MPDRGLFGKNFSRIFNYIQCYIFRFFIVDIVMSLILYPIVIFISTILITIFIVTFWIWLPIIFMATYLFNILIFQFKNSKNINGCWIKMFPLFVLILSVIFYLFAILFFFICAFILYPIASILVIIFAIVHRLLRIISDSIMLFFIKHLGRTPSKNSGIAQKISGPGMSK